MVQLEGWSELMYDSMHSVSGAMPAYWVALVIVLAFGMNRFQTQHLNIPFYFHNVFCSMFLGVMCDLTLGARSRRLIKEAAETSAFKMWLKARAGKLEKTIRQKTVAKSKFLSFFFDQVYMPMFLQEPSHHFAQTSTDAL
jgi:hypothetical protein